MRRVRSSSVRPAISSSPPEIGGQQIVEVVRDPPVSWPTASIFCAWRSASSARSRSCTSAALSSAVYGGALGDTPFQRLVELAQRRSACLAS
jgi:hypothetical protein